jgi:hypothetical protein
MKHYAIVAEGAGADVLCVGSELVSAEGRSDQWLRTIRMVRKIYKGKLTYSANWDAYTRVPFWEHLDIVGMNSYYTLGDDHRVSVGRDRQPLESHPARAAAIPEEGEPPDPVHRGRLVQPDQRRPRAVGLHEDEPPGRPGTAAQALPRLLRSLAREPSLGGFMFWEWTNGEGGEDDRGYTPENKPAEKVLREWLGKPWK